MVKGHLLINQPDHQEETNQSCFRQLTIGDAAIVISGIQLAFMVGYLLHLTVSYDADTYPEAKGRVNIFLIVVPIMIAVVMLTVFGIVDQHLWMIIPNILAQLAFIGAFIASTYLHGSAVANFQYPDPEKSTETTMKAAEAKLYSMKVFMAWSIVGLILSILGAVVLILCFLYILRLRRNAEHEKQKSGY